MKTKASRPQANGGRGFETPEEGMSSMMGERKLLKDSGHGVKSSERHGPLWEAAEFKPSVRENVEREPNTARAAVSLDFKIFCRGFHEYQKAIIGNTRRFCV